MGNNQLNSKWVEHKSDRFPEEYKGFRLCTEKNYKLMGKVHLKFSNGEKELFVSGNFRVEAYMKMLDRIDKYQLDGQQGNLNPAENPHSPLP